MTVTYYCPPGADAAATRAKADYDLARGRLVHFHCHGKGRPCPAAGCWTSARTGASDG